MCTSPATTPPASPTSDSPHDRNNQKCHTLQEDAPTRSVSCIPCLTGEFAAFRFFLRCHQPGSLVALVAESAAGLLQDIRGPGLLECPRVMRLPGQRAGNPGRGPVEKGYQLRVEARGLVLLVPQFLVLFVGPAGCQRAVYQDDPALDHLDGLLG